MRLQRRAAHPSSALLKAVIDDVDCDAASPYAHLSLLRGEVTLPARSPRNRPYERLARGRRLPEPGLVCGAEPFVSCSPQRSIRTTGRMITVAVSGLTASGLGPRPTRATAGKLMTVPISSPAPRHNALARLLSRFEMRKVNGLLTQQL